MSRAIDGYAPSTDSAAPSTDPSMAQQSVDGTALSVDTHGTDSARSVDSTERSVLSASLTVCSLFDVARKNNAYLNFLYGV